MGKIKQIKFLEDDLQDHPAFLAWNKIHPGSAIPKRIEIFKGRLANQNREFKRFVCKLEGVGKDGASVIGKCCLPAQAETENTIYKEILPYLPISSLKYFGMVAEASGEYLWLFLEDAGEMKYSEILDEHRLLSAQWLAGLHTSASQHPNKSRLPEKGPKYYLNLIQTSRDLIWEKIKVHKIQGDGLELLKAIISNFDFLEAHWDQLEELYNGLPLTIVHGDFVSKNFRIRNNHNGLTFLPFDWGEAGWGSPVTDILHVDTYAYWSSIRSFWSWLSLEDIQRSKIIGKIFRSIDSICWTLGSFRSNKKVLNEIFNNMKIFNSRLAESITKAIITA